MPKPRQEPARSCSPAAASAPPILRHLAESPARDAVDWHRLDVWWGDERFLPTGDPERNETCARAALLDHVDVDPARVHPMPGPDGPDGHDPEAAARRYAALLAAAARPEDHGPVPTFDVLLLGVGPDGHVASLFPDHPALHDERPVVAVRGSPKPPPIRLTLTLPAINAAAKCGWSSVAQTRHLQCGSRCPGPGRSPYRQQVPTAGSARCGCSMPPRRRNYRATSPAPRRPSNRSLAGAELVQRLGQDRLAVGVVAPLADVGEVGLVGLVARRGRRARCGPDRRGSRTAGSPSCRGSPRRRRTTAGSRARSRTRRTSDAAERTRRAPPHPSAPRRLGCRGSRCHQPRCVSPCVRTDATTAGCLGPTPRLYYDGRSLPADPWRWRRTAP